MPLRKHKPALDELLGRYHRPEYIHPDPLMLVRRYGRPRDREVAALVAGLLAYGRVKQILASAGGALEAMGPSPARYLRDAPPREIRRRFAGFRHRFQTGREFSALLLAVRSVLLECGSLEACFLAGFREGDATVLPALRAFRNRLDAASGGVCGHLLPDPARGSACKRWHLMLRWLVRQDAVDPGGWSAVPARALLVPLDVHMHRVCYALGATTRRSPGAAAAEEATAAFRRIAPQDPVRYDFALTRLGIHPDASLAAFLAQPAA